MYPFQGGILFLLTKVYYAMITKLKIYDLDGTIINSLHRYRTNASNRIDLDYWIKNDTPENIFKDTFLTLKKNLDVDLLNPETYVIFATARACVAGDANYDFLEHHGIVPDMFIHRQGRNDSRGGAQLKIEAIKPLLKLDKFKTATIHVFEDNIKYMAMMCEKLGVYHHPIVGHFVPSLQGH